MTRYSESETYQPYAPHDRAFMAREGEPCRRCLNALTAHYNGRCPVDEDDAAPAAKGGERCRD